MANPEEEEDGASTCVDILGDHNSIGDVQQDRAGRIKETAEDKRASVAPRDMVKNVIRRLLETESYGNFIGHGKNNFISRKCGIKWKTYSKTAH